MAQRNSRGSIALLASHRIMPSALIPAYRLCLILRDAGLRTIGGFHTQMERECLEILLRGQDSILICPARAFNDGHRLYSGELWSEVQRGIKDGRVRIQPPPAVRGTRITRKNAEIRNAYLLEIAERMLVLSTIEGSRTTAMAYEALRRGMPVFVMDHPSNAHLLEAGARIATIEALTESS